MNGASLVRSALGAGVAVLLLAAAPALADPLPAPVSLDGPGWSYLADPTDTGLFQGLPAGDGVGWRPVTVPDVMDSHLGRADFRGGVGWYMLALHPPPLPGGFTWALRFAQVRRTSTVWLNGVQIATNDDPYAPFTVPIPQLDPDGPNTLVLRVDSRRPKGISEGWWNWGGITEPVTLVPEGGVVLHDPALMPTLTCDAAGHCSHAVLDFDGTLENRTAAPVTPTIAVTLTPPAGAAGAGATPTAQTITAPAIPPDTTVRVRAKIPVAGTPLLWAPGSPHLYAATMTTSVDGVAQQADDAEVGLRSIRVVNSRLLLNGRPVQLRGAAIEQDAKGSGAALSDAQIADVVRELKAAHATVTRAQYLLDDRMLSALDRAGILVWEQAPIYSRNGQLHTERQRLFALGQLRHTILADRGHPSVLTNSVANELTPTPDHDRGVSTYLIRARALDHDLDPTRPAAVDLLGWPNYPRSKTYGGFRLLGLDCYYGWYPGPLGHSAANFDKLAPFLARSHRQYPRSALVMTEFGAESTHAGPANERLSYAFQSNYVRETLAVVDGAPFMNGAIYWTLREFAVKPRWDGGADEPFHDRNSLHHKGLIAYDGVPKPAFAVAAKLFAATPLYRPAPPR
jgi:hypothetical protein